MKKSNRWLIPVGIAVAGLVFYTFVVEPRWLQVKRTRLYARRLPYVLNGLRIVLLPDLHVGSASNAALMRRAARFAMRERADLIALTGNLTRSHHFEDMLDALSGLTAPLGVYAVPGDHDHMNGIDAWHRGIARCQNINDLTNAYVVHEQLGARLCIAGLDDVREGIPELTLPPAEERDFTILLAHSPDQAARSRGEGIDLVLSGRGRFGARPEISVLELSNAPRPRSPQAQAAYLRRVTPS